MSRRAFYLVLVLAVFAGGLQLTGAVAETTDNAARVEAMYAKYKAEDFPDVEDLTAEEAKALLADPTVLFVDVRALGERKVSVIPGSIAHDEFLAHPDSTYSTLVLYCTIGYRSGKATYRLMEEGVQAFNLRGGILAWAHASGQVVDPADGKPTQRIHVYGRQWSLLPSGWKPVW